MTNVYELITQQILQQLEAGTVPWRPTWRGGEAGMPRNLVSGRPYRGINVWLLALAGYGSPYWLTFRQAQERGGQVRKGEKGQRVVLWRWRERQTEDGETERIPLLRYYTVFNAAQVDGLEAVLALEPATYEHAPLAECEALIDGMDHPPWMLSSTDQPCYAPDTDTVNVPPMEAFESPEAYYATVFHEIVHATGHESRLARPGVVDRPRFASHAYSKEELIAEMGAAYLCGVTGIAAPVIESQAAYIDGWLRVLRGDARLVITAAAAAQKAADWVRGVQFDE
jgi:antirestriction protein ArdC